MRHPWALVILLACLATLVQANILSYIDEIPRCSLPCIVDSIPASECQSALNETCVCNSPSLHDAIQDCVLATCTVSDALALHRIQDKACGLEPRDRNCTGFLKSLLGIEIFTFVCILVRLYARWALFKKFEADDYGMMATTVIWLIFTILGEYSRGIAIGRDIWEVDPDKVTASLIIFYVDEGLYLLLLAMTKLSILGFYLRVFPGRMFRNIVFWIMALICSTTISFIIVQIFQCWPIESVWLAWKGDYGPRKCVDIQAVAFSSAGLNIAYDLIVIALPFPFLLEIKTSRRKKVGIFTMFSLGILVVIISCLRLPQLHLFKTTMNPTWDFTDALIWTALEVHISIIIACSPAIRQFLSSCLPKVFGGTTERSLGQRSSRSTTTNKSASRPQRSNKSLTSLARDTLRIPGSASRDPLSEIDNESQIELGTTIKGHSETRVDAVSTITGGDRTSMSDDGGLVSITKIHITTTVNVSEDRWG